MNVGKLVADARKALASGNSRLALIFLRNAVSAAPRNTAARMDLGVALLRYGDAPNAERELRQARKDGAPDHAVLPLLFEVMLSRGEYQLLLDQFPEPDAGSNDAAADILKARALALQHLKQPAEALQAMDRSLELRRDVSGVLTRARLLVQQGDMAGAVRLVDEAIQTWPDKPEIMLFKVELLLTARDNSAALSLADQVSAKYPNSLPSQFARIEAYLRLNQDAKAKAEIEKILAQQPGLFMALYYKSLLMARAGDPKGAWKLAQSLPSSFRDADLGVGAKVAQMALNAGDIETGASLLGRILSIDPDQVAVRLRLAAIRVQQNSLSIALNILRPVQDSTDPRVVRLLSLIHLQMHRPQQALDDLRKLSSKDASVTRSIALLEVQQGDPDAAIKTLTEAVSKEPTNPTLVAQLFDLLAQKRRYAEALAVADRFGSDPRQRAQALVYRGFILMLQRDAAGARAAFDKAIAMSPNSKTALYSRANLFLSTQKYAEADRDLKAILSRDSKDVAAIMKSAEIAMRLNDDQNVRRLLGQAITVSPRDAQPRIVLVRYLISRRDLKGAMTAANDCQKAQPSNSDCVLHLGQIQSTLGQTKESVISFRRYATLKPELASAQMMLGAALSLSGDGAGASRAFNAAVDLAPQSPEVKRAQINFQLGQGKTAAALALARSFQASYPGTEADLLLADTFVRAKRSDEAEAALRRSLSERPDSVVLLRLVQLMNLSNDKMRAAELMRNWLAAKPNDKRVRLDYAGFLMQWGENAQATSQYQMVLKQDPDNILALNNLAWLIQRDDPKRAIALLTRASKLSPNSGSVADTLGWLKLQQKDVAGGLALLDRAHALEPNNGEITYHLVVALDANAKRDAARKLLKSLLASGVSFKDRPAAMELSSTWL